VRWSKKILEKRTAGSPRKISKILGAKRGGKKIHLGGKEKERVSRQRSIWFPPG